MLYQFMCVFGVWWLRRMSKNLYFINFGFISVFLYQGLKLAFLSKILSNRFRNNNFYMKWWKEWHKITTTKKNEKKNWFNILLHLIYVEYWYYSHTHTFPICEAMTHKLERNMVNMCGINITYSWRRRRRRRWKKIINELNWKRKE